MIAKEINNINGNLPQSFSLVNTDSKNIIIDTVKKAENNDNVIFRLYESQNIKGRVKLTFGVEFKKLYICDLLENTEREIKITENTAEIDVNNFEIITLMATVK